MRFSLKDIAFIGSLKPAAPPAPPALVQQSVGTTYLSDLVITLSQATGASVVIVAIATQNQDSLSVSDDQGSGYAPVGAQALGTDEVTEIWYATGVAGITRITVSGASGAISANVSEWSGLNANPEDAEIANGNASTTITSPTATPISANNVVIAVGGYNFASNVYTAGPTNGFTRMTTTGANSIFQETAYKIQTSATAQSTAWTLESHSSSNWASSIAVFGAP